MLQQKHYYTSCNSSTPSHHIWVHLSLLTPLWWVYITSSIIRSLTLHAAAVCGRQRYSRRPCQHRPQQLLDRHLCCCCCCCCCNYFWLLFRDAAVAGGSPFGRIIVLAEFVIALKFPYDNILVAHIRSHMHTHSHMHISCYWQRFRRVLTYIHTLIEQL